MCAARCLDLHALHMRYVNSKFGQRDLEYAEYVGTVADFDRVSKAMRRTQPYRCGAPSWLHHVSPASFEPQHADWDLGWP